MLRFFHFDEPSILKLLLEGDLNQASLPQYEKTIASAKAERGDRKLLVDVKDLRLADLDAEQALLEGRRSGLQFVAAEGRIAELLSKEERCKCRRQPRFTKRVQCLLTELRESLTRPVRLARFSQN